MSVLMADSTRPWLIPHTLTHVLVYGNGRYKWTDDQIDAFPRHATIGVLGGVPLQARYCRELDVERFDGGPSDVGPFVRERNQLGHRDATIYCDRSAIPAVAENVPSEYRSHFRWHIATLDGTREVAVPFGIVWAVQFETVQDAYDVSEVHGPMDFATH